MPTFRTDEKLLYNNGIWGQLGYAVPNYGNDPTTVNEGIATLVSVIGRNLQALMHHPDVDLRTPPTINTLTRVHRLVIRARQILGARAIAAGTPNQEPMHSAPAPEDFMIYPIPHFKVRNEWMKRWSGYILASLSEAMQHTENRRPIEISTTFAGLIGQNFQKVYRQMCTELFMLPAETVTPEFVLSEEMLKAYEPGKFFTSTEMIDTVPPLDLIPTEDDLVVLTDGIPASKLLNLTRWPSGSAPATGQNAEGASAAPIAAVNQVSSQSVPAFPPAPGL